MVAGAPGRRHRVVVVVVVVVSAAWPSALARGDQMKRTWEEIRGGVDLRAAGSKALPHQTVIRCRRAPDPRRLLKKSRLFATNLDFP